MCLLQRVDLSPVCAGNRSSEGDGSAQGQEGELTCRLAGSASSFFRACNSNIGTNLNEAADILVVFFKDACRLSAGRILRLYRSRVVVCQVCLSLSLRVLREYYELNYEIIWSNAFQAVGTELHSNNSRTR
jgi:hypothetical protein